MAKKRIPRNGTFTVYCISNMLNGKCYIGQTKYTAEERWSEHVKEALTFRGDRYFHTAIRKHGMANFSVVVLRSCHTRADANVWEKYFINAFASWNKSFGYNGTFGGDGVVANEETVAKIRAASIERYPRLRDKLIAANTGKKPSPETLERLSVSHMGHKAWNKGKKWSPEHLANITSKVWNRGIPCAPETREKIRIANSNPTPETRARKRESHLGKKQLPETIAKIKATKQRLRAERQAELNVLQLSLLDIKEDMRCEPLMTE